MSIQTEGGSKDKNKRRNTKPDSVSGAAPIVKPTLTGVDATSGAAPSFKSNKPSTPTTPTSTTKPTTPLPGVTGLSGLGPIVPPQSRPTTPTGGGTSSSPTTPGAGLGAAASTPNGQQAPPTGGGGSPAAPPPAAPPPGGQTSNNSGAGGSSNNDRNRATNSAPAGNGSQPYPEKSAPTAPNNNVTASFVDTTEQVFNGLDNLAEEMRNMGAEGMAALAVQYGQMTKMIDALQQQIVGQLQNQMGGIDKDPQLLAAIGVIREEVERQRQSMLEELNAKGMAQSGILLEMSDRLNKGQLTQVQQLVASRFGDLQNQLNQAVMNFAGMRINALQGYQNNYTNMYNTNMSNIMQLGLAKADTGMQAAGLQSNWGMAQMKDSTDRYIAGLNNTNQYNIAAMNNNNAWNMNNVDNATQRYGYDIGAATDIYKTDANNQNNLDVTKLQGQNAANVANINGGYDIRKANIAAAASGGGYGSGQNPADMANQAVSEILRDYPTGKLGYRNVSEVYAAIDNNPNIPTSYKQDMKNQISRAVSAGRIPWALR